MKKFLPSHSIAALLLGALAALFYSPLLLGLRTFPDGDFTHHFLPFSLFQQSELLAGRIPLWNPYTYSGHPFLADTQAAVFYPLNLLMLAVSQPFTQLFESAAAHRLYFLQIEAILHVALAGFFVYLLVNELTKQKTAGLLAGIVFAFSGYLTSYPPLQLAVLRTAIWLPLLLFLLLRAMHSPQQVGWWIGAVLAATSAFMAGHPQTILHMGYVIVAWVTMLLIYQTRFYQQKRLSQQKVRTDRGTQPDNSYDLPEVHSKGSSPLPNIVALALSATLVVGLSAIQLLPSLEFLGLSVRAETSYDFVSAGFPLRDTWQLILPGVFTWFSPLYIGIIGLGLAVCALGADSRVADLDTQETGLDTHASGTAQDQSRDEPRRLPLIRWAMLFFVSLTVIALLISYGRNSFLYPLFYRFAPGWDLFRQQERAAYLVTFGLSILAGIGFAAIHHMPLKRRRLLIVVYAAVITGSVYTFGLLWQVAGETVISNLAYIGMAAGTLLMAALVAVSLWWEGWERRRTLIIFVLTVGNLFAANISTNLSDFGPERMTILSPEMEALDDTVAEQSPAQSPAQSSGNVGLMGRVYNEFRIYDDYGMRQAIEDVWGSSPLKLAHYAMLFEEFPLDRMWRLTGVEHVLTWRQELFEPSTLLGEFPQSEDTTFLHKLNEPNPRAWVVPLVYSLGVDDQEQITRLMANHQLDLEINAIIMQEDSRAPRIGQGSGIGLSGQTKPINAQINLVRKDPTTLKVDLTSEAGGFLVVSENFMPGLEVISPTCNGDPTQCFQLQANESMPALFEVNRTNLAFIGLAVPPGSVSFDLAYRPASFRNGLWISLTTAAVILAISLVSFFKRARG